MAEIAFVWDQRTVAAWRERLPEKAIKQALQRAGASAVRTMKAAATRSVRQRKRIKVTAVQGALRIKSPRSFTRVDDLVWRMDVSGKAVRVIDYPGASQGPRGVRVRINAGKRTLIPQAFIATMKSGHRGVFLRALSNRRGPVTRRMNKRGERMRVARLKIEEAFTTRVSDIFGDEGMIPALQGVTMRTFVQTFERNCIAELNKLNRDHG